MVKFRTGFVSNSSSSSFVCGACGEAYEGWDGDYGDITEFYCENSHMICSDCFDIDKIPDKQLKKYWKAHKEELIKDDITEYIRSDILDYVFQDPYEFPEELCPLCQFVYISERDRASYMKLRLKMNFQQIEEEMRERVKNYAGLWEFEKKNIPE